MTGRLCASIVTVLLTTASTATAQEAKWLQNFEEAKAKAKADGKDLLVDFTGSDWCVWCKRLDKEVFAEPDFQTEINKGYVLVKLDFPQDESLVTEEVKAQNTRLQGEYGVQGYPTVFLLDAGGRPYAQTGYQQGGAKAYLDHVAGLQKAKAGRDEHFGKAKDAKGVDRAKHLASGLDAMAEALVLKHYRAEVDEIVQLDAKNEAGLQDKYATMLASTEIETKFMALANESKWDEVETMMTETLTKYKGKKGIEQKATFYRAVVALESKQDFATALKLMDEARAFDPESEFGKQLVQIRKNVERIQAQQGGGEPGKEPGKDEGKKDKDGGN